MTTRREFIGKAAAGAALLATQRGFAAEAAAGSKSEVVVGKGKAEEIIPKIFKKIGGSERFRPILMTAFSSILGFLPLLVAFGAGAASRQSVGTAVVGGMIAATCFCLLFVPGFFTVFQRLSESRGGPARVTDREASSP